MLLIRPNPRDPERGTVLVIAVLILMLVGTLTLGHLKTVRESNDWTERDAEDLRLQMAAESVATMTINEVWAGFLRDFPDADRSRWDFRFYLDDVGINEITDDLAVEVGSPLGLGRLSETLAALTRIPAFKALDLISLPAGEGGRRRMSDLDVLDVDVWRQDTTQATHLIVEVTVEDPLPAPGAAETARLTAREVFTISEPEWEGLEYALLANNINCVMCHTEVDNAFRFYNEDEGRYGSYGRVRVGSIESFQIRHDPHSTIAGTLYLRGQAIDEDGRTITGWEGLSLDSMRFNELGLLEEDSWGDLTSRDLSPANAFDPQPFENLYLEYGIGVEDAADGYLPDSFPAPFPDDGGYDFEAGGPVTSNAGNRRIDDSEFAVAVASSTGTITSSNLSVLPPGARIASEDDLENFTEGRRGELTASTEGTVYLYGTEEDPIRLDGSVAVDGDLVIHGYVEGMGSLNVRGNVYVPSDLIYADGANADGSRTYSYNSAGQQNGLAIAAGGNTLVGDFFHPRFGEDKRTTGEPGGSFNFIMEELAIFNRSEWMKTQPTLPGKRERITIGEREVEREVYDRVRETYMKEVNVYEWVHNGLPDPYGKEERVKVGTKWVERKRWVNVGEPRIETVMQPIRRWITPEIPNPHYKGPNYVPRFYTFGEDTAIVIANKDGHFDADSESWIGPETVDGWDNRKLTTVDPSDHNWLNQVGGPSDAVITSLTAGWIDEELLEEFLSETLADRDTSEPFEIDGILYSNNSIFGIAPGSNKEGSDGRMRINGSIVAADIGLLAPNGFEVNYDTRGPGMLNLRSDRGLTIRRQAWLPPGE